MEIGFIYSDKDPRQTRAWRFVKRFVRERGLAAKIEEAHQEIDSPVLIVNGRAFKDERKKPRRPDEPMFPGIDEITRVLEESSWSL